MQTENKFLDDLAKLASGAVGTVHGMKSELESAFRQKMNAWLADMDLVQREEFDAVKAMAEKARLENEALTRRLDALEKKATPLKRTASKSGKKAATSKTASSKASGSKASGSKASGSKAAGAKTTATKAADPGIVKPVEKTVKDVKSEPEK